MPDGQEEKTEKKDSASESFHIRPPAISLPKGGGAIKGIGEKFAANPVTGTGSMTVPIATSPGRSGFGPQLSLSYDSGSGNGPFGFGWNLSLPSITRKTDKGLPQYRDAEESDEFILSGAEDLVPVLVEKDGKWEREKLDPRTEDGIEYQIQRYHPRIEGLFARIERWTNQSDPTDVSWRSISKDNITTWYGKTENSRIADPEDKTRIFSWLICQSYDDKGNAIVYEYECENSNGVDTTQAHENNRTENTRSANRYLKWIKYGNLKPNRDLTTWQATDPTELEKWMFEVVFDYDDGHYEKLPLEEEILEAEQHRYVHADIAGTKNENGRIWPVRQDPFSSYRAGFEVRTYRLCHRVLMFHHFPDELGMEDYLVRSTELIYEQGPIASFIKSVTQSGYRYIEDETKYLKKSLPPLEFEYSKVPSPHEFANLPIQEIDSKSLENLPVGLDGRNYQWVDLDGEGISGILTEQADAWFYKANRGNGQFGPLVTVAAMPSLAALSNGQQQLLDLAGDGQLDLVQFSGSTPGFYERTQDEDWEPFIPFVSLPNIPWDDPNLRFVDLNGDGHADILITENEVFTWYPSLAEEGFGHAEIVRQALEEEKGPRLVFDDGTQSIYLADLSGDGLSDLARIRNGEVCYWPNLGYGRFGAKVTMDNAPWFDFPDQFDQQRIRTADIDGSGTTDIIYLGRDEITIFRNQCGNSWDKPESITTFPPVDNLSTVMALDLLGSGTACLVWSTPLPDDMQEPMKYIDLMKEGKPHLLTKTVNNLGAETEVQYAPSTKFYLKDKEDGKPWITKLPFPVHVVERVVTYDHISRNRFVTHYAYHHGYFDGEEREFRGFGMVEQLDTEEYAALSAAGEFPQGNNIDEASHVPPVLTKTWFHTGAYVNRNHISNYFAGLLDANDTGEYYREPGLNYLQAEEPLLADTILPGGLTVDEEHEACRVLKGLMLRQEIYSLDRTEKEKHPYSVTEQNFTVRCLQSKADNKPGVFFTHTNETINYHYERNPADPRISHLINLEVDDFGNVLKSASIGYGRRETIRVVESDGQVRVISNPELIDLDPMDQEKQTHLYVTYTENDVTNPMDLPPGDPYFNLNNYRVPLPSETKIYELTGYTPTGNGGRFQANDFVQPDPVNPERLALIIDSEINYEDKPTNGKQRRLIEDLRTLYRKNDLTRFLALGDLESLALPGQTYKLAFTPGLLDTVFRRQNQDGSLEDLLPVGDRACVLGGEQGDQGGYVDLDGDGCWWIPSGRLYYDKNANIYDLASTAAQELTAARDSFFLPRKYADPFHQCTKIDSDVYNLLLSSTTDALDNTIEASNDYRVLQPQQVKDPNGNRTTVEFDALGMVVATAVKGKEEENLGDLLEDFDPDPTPADLQAFFVDPLGQANSCLGKATTHIVYDLDRYKYDNKLPFAATLVRETHFYDPGGDQSKIQISFSYFDGLGREIQKKFPAEPGKVPKRDSEGKIIVGPNGQPAMTENDASPRWVGSGWTVFNNKGKPVRQYEPFFTDTHYFELDTCIGVTPIFLYDPVGRNVATLHPNHTYEKVVFDPWKQTTYDVNDTVSFDPRNDSLLRGFVLNPDGTPRIPSNEYHPTWHQLRTDVAYMPQFIDQYPKSRDRSNETAAANKAAAHTDTPTTAYFDTLGRPFLTVVHNKVACPNHDLDGTEDKFCTRVELDIEGNQREVWDERNKEDGTKEQRMVMLYDYFMAGPEKNNNGTTPNRIHQSSMEAGERWMLNDVTGKSICTWDSKRHNFITVYDQLRRPIQVNLLDGAGSVIVEETIYGEGRPNPEVNNLRGQAYQIKDQAGIVTSENYDFKGNLIISHRQLAQSYKTTLNWSAAVPMEAPVYAGRTRYDALNRPIQLLSPYDDQSGILFNVVQPSYNEANLLESVSGWLSHNAEPDALLDPDTANLKAVVDIDYNAKGQRSFVEYGNGVQTQYDYDPLTFRLRTLFTKRGTGFPRVCMDELTQVERQQRACPRSQPICKGVQNLHYTYDPAGNIAQIHDYAQQTVYFQNKCVEPSASYTYDSLYRLIEATGREHLGQAGRPAEKHSYNDMPRINVLHPSDGNAMGTYIERYVYDAVGNILEMQHRGSNPAHPGWTRTYTYDETSQIENGTGGLPLKKSNRLTSSAMGASQETYSNNGDGYDPHGNMLKMPHLQVMEWDFKDQLQMTQRQRVDDNDAEGIQHEGEKTWYVYDASGQRVRKVTELGNGNLKEERIYLGGFEIFRKHSGANAGLVRETLHIMDDKQRIALIDTRIQGNEPGVPEQLVRYQFNNHLGSASLELDQDAKIISYEESYPYGSTSYQAVRTDIQVPQKRYRYSGKERDNENGLYYYGARYYAPWLSRWTTPDPAEFIDGINLFKFVSNNPKNLIDKLGLQSTQPIDKENNPPPKIEENNDIEIIDVTDDTGQVIARHILLRKRKDFWASRSSRSECGDVAIDMMENAGQKWNIGLGKFYVDPDKPDKDKVFYPPRLITYDLSKEKQSGGKISIVKEKSKEALQYMVEKINQGLPSMVGVNITDYDAGTNELKPTTDHFVLVVGYELKKVDGSWSVVGLQGLDENASNAEKGLELKFTFDENFRMFSSEKKYEISQVRFYKKDFSQVRKFKSYFGPKKRLVEIDYQAKEQ